MESVTKEIYAESIIALLHLARHSTSSGRAAAQVLLSAYNGYEWQLNIVDLTLLDKDHYQSAMNVIQGRIELNRGPYLFIKNGGVVFEALWDRWSRYHISNRWKDDCDYCGGTGTTYPENDQGQSCRLIMCNNCLGTGMIQSVRY